MATCKFCGKQSGRRAPRCISCSQIIPGFRPGDLVETIKGSLVSGGGWLTSHWEANYLAKVESISRNRIFIKFEDTTDKHIDLTTCNYNSKEIRKLSAERTQKYLFPSPTLVLSRKLGLSNEW